MATTRKLASIAAIRPATGPTVLARIGAALRLWHFRMHSRRQLGSLNDRMLADIGLTRADVAEEISKSFWRA